MEPKNEVSIEKVHNHDTYHILYIQLTDTP
jgi:hypothetical protein